MRIIDDIGGYFKQHGEPDEVKVIRDKILTAFKDIEFFEEGHKYIYHSPDGNDIQLPSVSGITHQYKPPFEEYEISENYALKHGETGQYWRDMWKHHNLVATTTGTLVHEYGESMAWIRMGRPDKICDSCKPGYIKDRGWLIPTREKEKAVLKFWCDMPDCYHVILPEARIFRFEGMKQPYAGTFDLGIWYDCKANPSKSGFILMDYKTNDDLYKQFGDTKLLGPFSDFDDQAYYMYILQLNLYQYALENIGIHVIDRRLIWLKPDGNYELVKVPDIQHRIKGNF